MRIVQTGTYNSANKGDAAMQLGALRQIASLYPASTVTILSPFPALDAPFYAPATVERCNRRNLLAATLDLARAGAWRMLPRAWRPRWLLTRPMRLVRDCDVVVDLSGDMLTDDYGPHVAYSHYIPVLRALVLGKPYFLCAQSIGPFRTTRALARLILTRAAKITVRDAISEAAVLAMGVDASRVEKTADLAFLLPPAPRERALEILRQEGFRDDGRPVLGISISRLIEGKHRSRSGGPAAGAFLELMASAIERVVGEQAASVIFIPHVTGPAQDKDDRRISMELKARLAPAVPATALGGDYRPEELKAVVASCSVFCGARMHANIAALSSGVPTVAVSYSHKTPGIMAEFGMQEFLLRAEDLTAPALGDLLSRAFRERAEIAAALARRIDEIRARAARNIAGLDRLAARGVPG